MEKESLKIESEGAWRYTTHILTQINRDRDTMSRRGDIIYRAENTKRNEKEDSVCTIAANIAKCARSLSA